MGSVVPDIRYALRALRRGPAYTAVALLTLAVGIGANASILSVTRAVFRTPMHGSRAATIAV